MIFVGIVYFVCSSISGTELRWSPWWFHFLCSFILVGSDLNGFSQVFTFSSAFVSSNPQAQKLTLFIQFAFCWTQTLIALAHDLHFLRLYATVCFPARTENSLISKIFGYTQHSQALSSTKHSFSSTQIDIVFTALLLAWAFSMTESFRDRFSCFTFHIFLFVT